MDQLALVTWESTALASFMLVVLGCAVLILGDQVCATEERKEKKEEDEEDEDQRMESGAAVGPYLGFQISYGNQANPIVNPECDLRHGPSSERVRRRAYPNNLPEVDASFVPVSASLPRPHTNSYVAPSPHPPMDAGPRPNYMAQIDAQGRAQCFIEGQVPYLEHDRDLEGEEEGRAPSRATLQAEPPSHVTQHYTSRGLSISVPHPVGPLGGGSSVPPSPHLPTPDMLPHFSASQAYTPQHAMAPQPQHWPLAASPTRPTPMQPYQPLFAPHPQGQQAYYDPQQQPPQQPQQPQPQQQQAQQQQPQVFAPPNPPPLQVMPQQPSPSRSTPLLHDDSVACVKSDICFEDLVIDKNRELGQGGFGRVYVGTWHGTPVAIKLLIGAGQCRVSEKDATDFLHEVRVAAQLRHPNICLFLGACLEADHRAIVTELVSGGNLWKALRTPLPYKVLGYETAVPLTGAEPWPNQIIHKVAFQTACGMNYLHTRNPPVLHRDLKSANILLDELYSVKICDFGLSRLKSFVGATMTGECGTTHWMAPEMFEPRGASDPPDHDRYNESADVYSYSMVLYELLTRRCPWEGKPILEVRAIMTANGERPSGIPSDAYPPFVRLMKSCWDRQPHLRPSFAAIIEMLNGMDENIRTGPALLAASPPRPPPQLRQQPMQMQMQQMQGQMQGQQPMQVRHPQAVHVAHQQQQMAPQPPYFNQYQDL